jgi:putative endonuclease
MGACCQLYLSLSFQRRLESSYNNAPMKQWFVYMLASRRNGTLYIGVTNDLARRIGEHKSKVQSGFTEKYDVNKLVYYEAYPTPDEAIRREKNMKAWQRTWKLRVIEELNPEWKDLSVDLLV